MADVKVFRKVALQVQSGSSYESNAMTLMPFNSAGLQQKTDPINDDSILGNGFNDIPMPGAKHQNGPMTQNLDIVSCLPIFEAMMGNNSSNVFTFANHSKKLSVCALNNVSANQYANAFLKRLKISGSVGNLIKLEYELFGTTNVVRAATSSFPASPAAPGEPMTFHEMSGTGFFRVGDAVDALSSSDNISIEDFSIEVTGGFDEQFDNNGTNSLIPVYGMTPFSVTGSFKVSRFDNNQWLTWSDNMTPLQASINIVKSASQKILIEIPRFIINSDITDDDLPRVSASMTIGRNGTGTNYKNTNMSFTSPFRITVTNS